MLLHPMLHLQQSLQLKLPGLDFWEAQAAIDREENLGKKCQGVEVRHEIFEQEVSLFCFRLVGVCMNQALGAGLF